MKERSLGTLAGLQLTVIPLAAIGSIGLYVIVVALMAILTVPIGSALLGGLIIVVVHWFTELMHQLGHAWAARRTGYPMLGIRIGTYGVLSTALYPLDEPPLPAGIHIRRALGGPFFSTVLSLIGFMLILAFGSSATALGSFVLWFFFLENFVVMTLQVFIPLGFNDGGTIWHWIRKR
jgi:hypothetical protein